MMNMKEEKTIESPFLYHPSDLRFQEPHYQSRSASASIHDLLLNQEGDKSYHREAASQEWAQIKKTCVFARVWREKRRIYQSGSEQVSQLVR